MVAEFYPRAADPVLGVWAHRQALASRDAGADVRVLVLQRPVPPMAVLRAGDLRAARRAVAQPLHADLDGIEVRYVPFVAPPRGLTYASWGAWAAPTLALALRRLHTRFPYDLLHAHYAVPAGDAVRRAGRPEPLVVSVHGGDVLYTARRSAAGRASVAATFAAARAVLANSADTERRCRELGARTTRVVHLGTDVPDRVEPDRRPPTLVTVGHLVARKRHADVIDALARLRNRHPDARYAIVGDGPEKNRLAALARELGVADRVHLLGQLPPEQARAEARRGTVFVLPSVDEAFGVAYIEAMAGGVPAIGCRGEGGPEEIAAAGDGIRLVEAGDVAVLAKEIDGLLSDALWRRELGRRARDTVSRNFTWERCGAETVAAYEAALAGP